MKDQIAKSVFWLVWSRGGIQLISFVSTLLVARWLAPGDYGLMALAGIWTATLSLIAEVGLGAAIIQFQDIEEEQLNFCFWATLILATLGYIGLYVASPSIAIWFESPKLSSVLRVAALALPFTALKVVPDSLLRKGLQLDKISQAEIVASLLTIPIMLSLAWTGMGVWALVAGAVLLPCIQTITTFRFVQWWPGLNVRGRNLKPLLKYSFTAFGTNFTWAIYSQIDSFILGKVSGEFVLGLYTMGKNLASLPVSKISTIVNQLASPMMAKLQNDNEGMRSSFLRIIRLVACVTVPMSLGLALEAEDVVKVILGNKWSETVPIVQITCLVAVVRSLEVLFPPVLFACYRGKFLFCWTVGLILIMPLFFWAGAKWNGALGVATVWVAVYPLFVTVLAREGIRELRMKWSTVIGQIIPVTTAALMMGLIVVAVRAMIPGSDTTAVVSRLILSGLMSLVVYGLGIMVQSRPLFAEVREIFTWVVRPRFAFEK